MGSLALLSLLTAPAFAGSIAAPATIGGPDAGAATASPVAIHYNPAAIAAADGVQLLLDAQYVFVRVDATTTRNDGIDPNTGEAYGTAMARVQVPVALVGATWQVLEDRLTVGFAATDAFVGGGDYMAGEPDEEAPFESHQRYAAVQTKIVTFHLIPAVGVTLIDGLHVGGSLKVILDSFDAIQASDPLGTEGLGPDGPYSADTLLYASVSGSHLGWSGGVFFDKYKAAQVGVSFTSNGTFSGEGEGQVKAPALVGGGEPAALISLEARLPSVIQAAVNSELNEKLSVGASAEVQLWGMCCGDHDGDIIIGVTSEDGDAIGVDPEDGLAVQVATTQYSPRRLQNAANFAINGGYQVVDPLWLGLRLGYNGNAVPDYAVSATNIDYKSVSALLAVRSYFGPMEVGVTLGHVIPFERTITNAAWDADEDSADYVDEYFSPKNPYKASTNGVYKAAVDSVGLRVGARF